MELYPKSPRHEKWVIICLKRLHPTFKSPGLILYLGFSIALIILSATKSFSIHCQSQTTLYPSWKGSAHAVKLRGILFRNGLSGFEGEPGNEFLGSDKSRLHGRPSLGVKFALRRSNVPSKQLLELLKRWGWMFLSDFVTFRHSLFLD